MTESENSIEEPGSAEPARVQKLAAAFPRILIAGELALPIARNWIERLDRSVESGGPTLPVYPFTDQIRQGLFEARRARRLVRGFEGAEKALASQEVGLSKAAATRPEGGGFRISRLLLVSTDGSQRFYRQVEQLKARFSSRLEALMIDADEGALGEAAFGSGHTARALLLDHKEVVVDCLAALDISQDSALEADSASDQLDPEQGGEVATEDR